jgi:aryl-alcohol dehydrogenase-like predicted oxidoreductase
VGSSRSHLISAVENSLRRLGTDYIDLYQLHGFDALTPVEETLATLDDLVRAGKIRYIGCSNYSGWHIMKTLAVADAKNLPRFVTQQIHYTLEAREAEYELLPISVDQGLGVMVWSPLAAGLLSGAFGRDKTPADSRQAAGWSEPPIRDQDRLWNIVDVLNDIAGARGVTAAQVSLAWTLSRPGVASLVVGGLTEQHFKDNIAAVDLKLTGEELERLNQVSRAPYIYPYWHQHNFAKERFTPGDWALHASYEDMGSV